MSSNAKKGRRTAATFDDYTFLNRWGLTFLGIWRLNNGGLRTALRQLHVAALFAAMTLLLIPQWLDLYVLRGNIDANAETFVLNVFTLTAMLKLYCFHRAGDTFEKVLLDMESNWRQVMRHDESTKTSHRVEGHARILLAMAGKGFDYTRRYGLLMYSTACMYFVSPFLGMQKDGLRARMYPFFGWYYFDRDSDLYYGLFYLSQVMIGIVVGTCNYSMDSIFFVAIYHSCAQFRIIHHDVERIGADEMELDRATTKQKLLRIIVKHQKEIRSAERLETMFNAASMQQLLVSCIIICVIGFKLIIALNDGGFEVLVYVAFMVIALMQIFLYCRPGDELITQSLAVGYAAWQSQWTNLGTESISKLATIIQRSQRPMRIAAGNVYVLSLPNFTMIIKTSMSFLSLLRAIYTKSD
ncbi:hypothetical protein TKK_0014971 [Trichogramma kaykai]|uniref:Odorant receptor n=1 Tax=Trichogramma kaykai TaxID=54128 RepID=A0ABD2WDA8_9HYME